MPIPGDRTTFWCFICLRSFREGGRGRPAQATRRGHAGHMQSSASPVEVDTGRLEARQFLGHRQVFHTRGLGAVKFRLGRGLCNMDDAREAKYEEPRPGWIAALDSN